MSEKILVCGAGGFVGGALVKFLEDKGYDDIVAVSFRPVDKWIYRRGSNVKSYSADLREAHVCYRVVYGRNVVYNLAAKVGGVGYIGGKTKADCLLSSLINTNLLLACEGNPIRKYLFASSSCVYPSSSVPLREDGPVLPSKGYGAEKLFSEEMCMAFCEERNLPVSIARFTGIYGPGDDIKGAENRDHVPSALCRQVVAAKLSGNHQINIWGDGEQTRNFLYIDDCVEACYRLACAATPASPINVGSAEVVTVNEMVTMLEEIACVKLERFYKLDAPEGVRHRSMDLTKLRDTIGWEPMTKLFVGLDRLYQDLFNQALKRG